MQYLLDTIAEVNDRFYNKQLSDTFEQREGKINVIFGAGIMGITFLYYLEKEQGCIFFCDNDVKKWGRKIHGYEIENPSTLEQQKENCFVFVALDDYKEVKLQLEQMGFIIGKNMMLLKNMQESLLIDKYKKLCDETILVLGDCLINSVGITEQEKQSLESLIETNNCSKVLSLNGLTIRWFYELLKFCRYRMEHLNKVIIALDISVFYEKFHLILRNQHLSLMEQLKRIVIKYDEEDDEFFDTLKMRMQEECFYMDVPDREYGLSPEIIENKRKMHMQLNYLYQIKRETESLRYIARILDYAKLYHIEIAFVIMPVNYEMGIEYFGKNFYVKYEKNRDAVISQICKNGGTCLDLSYLLKKDDFISIRSCQEGFYNNGRMKIWSKIKGCMEGEGNSE